jgi:hypothetical protein
METPYEIVNVMAMAMVDRIEETKRAVGGGGIAPKSPHTLSFSFVNEG